jgi:hypothetical protein
MLHGRASPLMPEAASCGPRFTISLKRSQAFTGQKAALLSNGRLFEAVASERLAAAERAVSGPSRKSTELKHPE